MLKSALERGNAMHTYSIDEYVCILLPATGTVISFLECHKGVVRNNNSQR